MGYCLQPPALIYEYMEEGSLSDKLFQKVSKNNIDMLCVIIIATVK